MFVHLRARWFELHFSPLMEVFNGRFARNLFEKAIER